MEESERWLHMARDAGFESSALLDAQALAFMPEVRDMCSADRCHQYGKNWVCPPACGSIDECAARAAQFAKGLLVQTVGDIEDSFDIENMMAIAAQHKERFIALRDQLLPLYPDLLAMGAGGCDFCERCTYPDAPCRYPDKAIPSMEAYGLMVNAVCTQSGLAYNYGPGKLAYSSCYLLT